jgi:hypothetical protein
MLGQITLLAAAAVGSTQPISTSAKELQENRRVVAAYAKCVLARHSKEVAEVVLSITPNWEIKTRHRNLIDPSCVNVGSSASLQIAMPGDTLRYALADALVQWEYASGLPADIDRAAPLQRVNLNPPHIVAINGKPLDPSTLERLKAIQATETGFGIISVFGECVARQDPQRSLQLILTKVASKQEEQAFSDLNHALATCVPAGQTVALAPSTVRGTIAVNLYRLAKGPQIAPTPPTGLPESK